MENKKEGKGLVTVIVILTILLVKIEEFKLIVY